MNPSQFTSSLIQARKRAWVQNTVYLTYFLLVEKMARDFWSSKERKEQSNKEKQFCAINDFLALTFRRKIIDVKKTGINMLEIQGLKQ